MRIDNRSAGDPAQGTDASVTWLDRSLWLCPLAGLVAGSVALWVFGFTLWTAIIIALLVACPAIAIILALTTRRRNPSNRRRP